MWMRYFKPGRAMSLLDASIAIEAGMKWQSRRRLAWQARDGLPIRIVDAALWCWARNSGYLEKLMTGKVARSCIAGF